MLHIGYHESSSGGYMAMGKEALSVNADTFAFFTRNPRGGQAKPIDKKDAEDFCNLLYHLPKTEGEFGAKNFCKSDNSVVEDSFVCGLLHDMGKVIFETNCPEYLENVKKICKDKITSLDLFEKIISGVNHGEIGAKIAEKWNFPESIINVIRFHHSPENAPEATKILAAIIYIANLMVHYHNSDIQLYHLPKTEGEFGATHFYSVTKSFTPTWYSCKSIFS